ncbi:MAG TPA: JAB domain-containing protein [Chloroflexota bacterium]|nr:JAB domain-containing protein [Chloroflexota bacterium]
MTRPADAQQISLLPPDAAELLHLVRQNLRLLAELVDRYEVGRLGVGASDQVLRSPADVAAYLGAELADLAQEQLRVVLLDTKNHVVGIQLVYQGGLNATAIRLADCFREAVARGAAALILVHNHPSGDPTPSPEDVRLTREAGRAGDLLGVELLDHIVVGRQGHVSLRERGLYARPDGGAVESSPSGSRSPAAHTSHAGGVTHA